MKRIVFQSLVIVFCLATVVATYGQVARRNTGATPPAANGATPAAPAAPKPLPASPNNPLAGGYLIQPNDVLSVFVYKYPDLSRERVLVLPDGRISVPLIQEIPVAGLTSLELKQKLEEILKGYVDGPNVTVSLESIQSYQVYIMGKVASPGPLVRATPISVMQAVAAAGGFGEFADKEHIVIFRGDERIRFNYDDYEKGKNQDRNIWLLSGDVVNVP
jgi:polysaccharide export outer membrane protein